MKLLLPLLACLAVAAHAESLMSRTGPTKCSDDLRIEYVDSLKSHIMSKLSAPVSWQAFRCVVQFQQDQLGTVLNVEVLECPDNASLQASIVKAVNDASPLPVPKEADCFDRTVRIAVEKNE